MNCFERFALFYLADLSNFLCFSPQHLPASTVCLQSQLWFTELLTTPSEPWCSLDPWCLLLCCHWLKAGPSASWKTRGGIRFFNDSSCFCCFQTLAVAWFAWASFAGMRREGFPFMSGSWAVFADGACRVHPCSPQSASVARVSH